MSSVSPVFHIEATVSIGLKNVLEVGTSRIGLKNILILFWCNGPKRGCSLDLHVDVGTSGRNEDDDVLSSD